MLDSNWIRVSKFYSVTVPGSDSVSVPKYKSAPVLQCYSVIVFQTNRQTYKQSVPVFQCQSVPENVIYEAFAFWGNFMVLLFTAFLEDRGRGWTSRIWLR